MNAKKIIGWVLAGLVALLFIISGTTKLLGVEMQLKNLESWGFPLWFRFPIGLSEIVLALGVLIPNYRKLSIYAIFVWTVIAVITHLRVGQTAMIVAPIVFSLLALILLFVWKGNREMKAN